MHERIFSSERETWWASKVGTSAITSAQASRLFHHALRSPGVKLDIYQLTSHLFVECKIKGNHHLKLGVYNKHYNYCYMASTVILYKNRVKDGQGKKHVQKILRSY